MPLLRTLALLVLLLVVGLTGCVVWLGRFEEGSRWLVERGLALLPVETSVSGVTGSLIGGLNIDRLDIVLTTAEIHVAGASAYWDPLGLFVGDVVVDSVSVRSLEVVPLAREESEPPDDALFWLQLPLDIRINSGRVERLQIAAALFENIELAGILGMGRLDVLRLAGDIEGVSIAASGRLAGPAPGELQATARWKLPRAGFSGEGTFSGSIDVLNFEHSVVTPAEFSAEPVKATGAISDLFSGPAVAGTVTWTEFVIPGERPVRVRTGEFGVESDFRTAVVDGSALLIVQGVPDLPVNLQAHADFETVRIDNFVFSVFGGSVAGDGLINYRDGLRGNLNLRATGIDTAEVLPDVPGSLNFAATVQIDAPDTLTIDVLSSDALLAGRRLRGTGSFDVRAGRPGRVVAGINAGANKLTANLDLSRGLAGRVSLRVSEPERLLPGLRGRLDADLELAGTLADPAGVVSIEASAVGYAGQSVDSLSVVGSLQSDGTLDGSVEALNVRSGERQLGEFIVEVTGTTDDHAISARLSNGLVDVRLTTEGGWRGDALVENIVTGRVQPDRLAAWELAEPALLRLATSGFSLGAHCWAQAEARLCLGESRWAEGSGSGTLAVSNFALGTFQPFLPEGYTVAGSVDVDADVRIESGDAFGRLRWRQSETTLGYSDEASEFTTTLDRVTLDVDARPDLANLVLSLAGENSLAAEAEATITGPLGLDGILAAEISAGVPDVALLRPLLQNVAGAGAIEGALAVDLDISGTLGEPVFAGGGNLLDGLVELPDVGITLSDIEIQADSAGDNALRINGKLRSGEGTARIGGDIRIDDAEGVVADLTLEGENLQTVRMPELSLDSSPDLNIHIARDQFDIQGSVFIPRATAELRDLPQTAVERSPDVIVHAPDRVNEERSTIVTGEVDVQLGPAVQFSGFGLESRLEGNLRLVQRRQGALRGFGTVRVRDGFLNGYGRELRVDRGDLTFTGPLDDPAINILVSRDTIYESRQYTIGLELSGTASNVRTEPYSRPGDE